MEPQETQNCQSNSEEKEQSWSISLSDFRQYYKAVVKIPQMLSSIFYVIFQNPSYGKDLRCGSY